MHLLCSETLEHHFLGEFLSIVFYGLLLRACVCRARVLVLLLLIYIYIYKYISGNMFHENPLKCVVRARTGCGVVVMKCYHQSSSSSSSSSRFLSLLRVLSCVCVCPRRSRDVYSGGSFLFPVLLLISSFTVSTTTTICCSPLPPPPVHVFPV